MSLTTIQNQILQYIRGHMASQGVAPSTSDICQAFGFRSFGTVARHMKRLEEKGYLRRAGRRNKQGVTLVGKSQTINVPLVGTVAAGLPIEAVEGNDESLSVPDYLVECNVPSEAPNGNGHHFALKVRGQSMVEDGIHDGDFIIVRKQTHAEDGQTVVALLENEATVKRFYHHKNERIELRPANAAMESIWVTSHLGKKFRIQGVVVGLLRQYS